MIKPRIRIRTILLLGLSALIFLPYTALPVSANTLLGGGVQELQPPKVYVVEANKPVQEGLSPVDGVIQIDTNKIVGGLYATVPRPLWDLGLPVQKPLNLSSDFGPRGQHFHNGLDFAAPWGASVMAIQDGIVVEAGYFSGYGYSVDIDHGNNVRTRYAHLSSYSVNLGEVVVQGDVIGKIGSTGNSSGAHLHLEIHIDDVPRDPAIYLPLNY